MKAILDYPIYIYIGTIEVVEEVFTVLGYWWERINIVWMKFLLQILSVSF